MSTLADGPPPSSCPHGGHAAGAEPARRPAAGPADDVFDPDLYVDGIPYDVYARLRSTTPVSWHQEPATKDVPAGPGFWAVMGHEDVQHVSKTPDVFSASLGCTQLRDPDPEDLAFLQAMLLNMDPPQHNVLRKTISGLFTPRATRRLMPFVEETTRRLVSEARERGEFDLVEDVTDTLSLSVLTEILGVPASDRRLFFDWANRIIGYTDEEYSGQTNPRSPSSLQDMYAYADTLREYRTRNPGEDVISALVHARVDGRAISDAEFKNFFFLLAVAGNDTTRSALPGGILTLMQHPDQLALLREQPELLGSAVEECLRYAPPVISFRRTATRDTVLRDVPITAGDKVVVFYPAANRDPREFADPDTFDIARSPNRHVSFGHGPHVCVAAAVARLQMSTMLGAFLQHLPGLALTGPVELLASNAVAGIKRAPVAVRPTHRRSTL